MAKLKKTVMPNGKTIIDCGGDKLRNYQLNRGVDVEFFVYYTSGLYDYVKYNGKCLLVER